MHRIIYLHGFASSPASRKAQFFLTELSKRKISVDIPDLAQSNFRNLTLSGQLRVVEDLVDSEMGRLGHGPVRLIGSSMGGYLAALYASLHPEQVDRLVLLAPAFRFSDRWQEMLGPEKLARWKKEGEMDVFHYGEGREVPLGYQLLEDAQTYPPFPNFGQPALLLHGTEDNVVPHTYSEQFVKSHPNTRLVSLPSGHELTDVLDKISAEAIPFLLAD